MKFMDGGVRNERVTKASEHTKVLVGGKTTVEALSGGLKVMLFCGNNIEEISCGLKGMGPINVCCGGVSK